MYRGELNPNGVAARCGARTKPRGCCGHHSRRDFDCAVPTLGLDDAIPGVEDPCKVQGKPHALPKCWRESPNAGPVALAYRRSFFALPCAPRPPLESGAVNLWEPF